MEGWQIVNVEETPSDAYPVRQLEVEGVWNRDGERDMIVRDVVQVVWESHKFVDGTVVVNLGQRPASIATSQMGAVQSFDAERQALLMLVLWLNLIYRLTGAVAEKDLIQIANLPECAEEEAGMGYPQVLID